MKIADINEAKTDTLYPLEIPFTVGTNGTSEQQVLKLKYRPITQDMLVALATDRALGLSQVIESWEAEEPLSYEFLSGRPILFLNRISEAITGDYFPKSQNSTR